MGAISSRPKYPFPEPGSDPPFPPKPFPMWSLSSKRRSKRGRDREKLDGFVVPKFPAPTATYNFPYYTQAQSAFPTYYAPVQMAFVQPFGAQQPLLAIPQSYVPMVTTAPVQPAVAPAPAIRSAPVTQMPAPAPAPALGPIPTPAPVAPPAPGPPFSSAPPHTAPTQMPQPYIPSNLGPVIPSSPVLTEPVIPPRPFVNTEPRNTPGSTRIRFTDFYRPIDPPCPRRPSIDEPVLPPTAGPPGRTPYSNTMPIPAPSATPAPMQMPTPAQAPFTIPTTNNPLPPPPVDVWDASPYRQVLANLPAELPDLLELQNRADILVGDPEPIPRPSSRLAGLFGSKDKGKKPLKGLFRSRSTAGQDDLGVGPSSSRHARSQTLAAIVIPPPIPGANGSAAPSTIDMPIPSVGPPVKFDHTGEYAGFVNHSPHRVLYKNKTYPTALHLLEAMKFIHQPALQERIRTCKDVHDMYPLSASFQEQVRPDWGQVFLKTMEEVLYLKFKQHPGLRALLLSTGLADIIYSDENSYWGDGPLGEGANELGKALVRLRDQLRQEGER